jgi:signal transduction histidine kinase
VDQLARARLAVAVAGVALVGGMLALSAWRVDLGFTLAASNDRVLIWSVAEHSPARIEGFAPGMVVLELNGVQLMQLPQYVYASPDPNGEVPSTPIGVEPLVPTAVQMTAGERFALTQEPVRDLNAIPSADLEHYTPDSARWVYIGRDYNGDLSRSIGTYLGGAVLLVVGSWWLLQGRGGRSLQPLAFQLAAAVATPLLVQPLIASWATPAIAIAGLLVPLAMLPLGLGLLERVPESPSRGPVRAAVWGAAAAAATIGVFRVWLPSSAGSADLLWLVLSGAIPLVPGIAAASPMAAPDGLTAPAHRVQSTELAVAGATPVMSLLSAGAPFALLFPLSAWLVLLLLAGRFTFRPLARFAVRAQVQRDLIVAATEAERARVAADIHDDALQELTLLVRRLDDAGDTEGADLARTISDRLRAICGDLRLPILDDLGVGPALDWLVSRIERLSGGEVRLERSDGTRLPMDVELGIFRVAQEALANAVKHGKPPIVVRYRATDAGASLSIDDAGPGIEPDAAARAEGEGRFGLLNMQQRAEQIGAILDVRRWPGGGTHVALEWRAR